MVRLVFRPYTQFRRTICTSVSLRASTRVSPGFTLIRHSSPSFGSQQICSYSNLSWMNDRSIVPLTVPTSLDKSSFTFIAHQGFYTQILAYTLDSLVRVSRRVNENHFVKIANARSSENPVTNRELCRTLSFKPTTRKEPPPAALRSALSWFLRQLHSLTSGYKFQLISLLIDYLPLAFFCETTWSWLPPHTRTPC
jgi:hypothetical protein